MPSFAFLAGAGVVALAAHGCGGLWTLASGLSSSTSTEATPRTVEPEVARKEERAAPN